MKHIFLSVLISFFLSFSVRGQFIDIRTPNFSISHVNAAQVIEDSLFFYPSLDSLLPGGKERNIAYFKYKVFLNNQNQAVFDTTTIVKDSFNVISHHFVENDTGIIEVGSIRYNKTNDSSSLDSRIWVKTDNYPHYDSISILPKLDTGEISFRIYKAIKVQQHLYLFGGTSFDYFPYSKAFALKYNLKTKKVAVNYYYCHAFFCLIHDAIYLPKEGKFIVTSTSLIRDTLAPHPFGGGIAKIDTNLLLDTASTQVMIVNYGPPLYVPIKQYNHSTSIFSVNKREFLIAGSINNSHSIGRPPNYKNNKYDEDIAVSLRSKDSLLETAVPNIYGKIDTGESQLVNVLAFEKVDSNLFVVASNMDFNIFFPESYNTSLALFGMNEAGKKHWELYLPYKSYCDVRKIQADKKGGLWVVAVCSETDPNPNIDFKSYVKVAYLDSLAFWPRNAGTLVGIEEQPSSIEKSFSIFPNPAKGQLTIKQFGLLERLHFKMYDLNGRLVQTSTGKGHQTLLNIEHLHSGMYVLRIERSNGESLKTEKIVVEE